MPIGRTYIIVECGTGHQSPDSAERHGRALQLVQSCAHAGADAAKFQLFVPGEPLFCPMPGDENRWRRWNNTILSEAQWRDVKKYGEDFNIDVFWSVFQLAALDMLERLRPRYVKVASRANKTFPYDCLTTPHIISRRESGELGSRIWPNGTKFLKCIPQYPSPLPDMPDDWCHKNEGLSDHSGTIYPGLLAISDGAEFLEVHVGADEGPDGRVCLSWAQLKLLCDYRDAVATMRQG